MLRHNGPESWNEFVNELVEISALKDFALAKAIEATKVSDPQMGPLAAEWRRRVAKDANVKGWARWAQLLVCSYEQRA